MKPRAILPLILTALLVFLRPPGGLAASEQRVALIIGNEAYKDSPLRNPVHDARDMAAVLKEVGFEVLKLENADKRAMVQAIDDFAGRLASARVGLFYFSGHGIQVNGRNYLLPTRYHITSESDVEIEGVDAYRVLGKMEGRGERVNIVILDACRNNPFARMFRSPTRGLARLDAPTGTLLAYATDPGNTALDGPGRNSPYTAALKKHVRTPGLTVEQVFKRMRQEVRASTRGRQRPWESTSLLGDFYFVPPAAAAAAGPAPAPPPTPPAPGEVPDYDALIRQRQEAEKKWAAWQARMEAEYAQAERYDRNPKLKPREKASAWSSFLSGFARDNPFSQSDDNLRKRAQERLSYWQDQAQVAMAERPQRYQDEEASFTNSLGMKFVLIPAGSFLMGSKLSAEEVHKRFPGGKVEWYQDEHPRHAVKITRPFYLQTTEVTVGQWRKFILDTGYRTEAETGGGSYVWTEGVWEKKEGYYWDNPGFAQTDSQPVVCVSWNDVQEYIKWLNRQEGTDKYRLPTEAEWEYACRAGTNTLFFWGDDPDQACRYANVADQTTRQGSSWTYKVECRDGYWFPAPVGSFQTNAYGLFDMIGNVWEWCQDWYGDYPSGSVTDPTGSSSGSWRVLRGGSWSDYPSFIRSAIRIRLTPEYRNDNSGFRLARAK